MTANKMTPRDWETLSAYLDGQLTSEEQARLEARLGKDPHLQRALGELQRTRSLVRSMPRLKAPRNFTLAPEQVGERHPVREKLFLAFRLASAVASILFILVLMGDFLGAGGLPPRPENLAAPSISVVANGTETEKTAPSEGREAEVVVEILTIESANLDAETQDEAGARTAELSPGQPEGGEESMVVGPDVMGRDVAKMELADDEETPPPMLTAPLADSALQEAERPQTDGERSAEESVQETLTPGDLPAPTEIPQSAEPMTPLAPATRSTIRILEATLVLVAAVTGLIAFLLKRRA